MDIERRFEDLGVDAITGLKLMRTLGLNQDDFYDEARFMRFKDVIDYFKDVQDTEYLFNKLFVGKMVDRLDHLWGYTQLVKQKENLNKSIEQNTKKLDLIMATGDDMAIQEQQDILNANKIELSKTNEQIYSYEK